MNLIEKLMRIDNEKVKEKETKKIKSKRLSKLIGADTEITIRELSGRKHNSLMQIIIDENGERDFSKNYDMNLMYCVEGIIDPPVKEKALMEHFGVTTPKDLCALLFDAEVGKIADEIVTLSGLSDDSEKKVKNS